MTSALVDSGLVLEVWDAIPNPIYLPNGDHWHCAADGDANGPYSILPVTIVDSGPQTLEAPVLSAPVVVGEGVQITRTWPALSAERFNNLVNAERDRRIALGVTVEVSTGKNVQADTRDEEDFSNITGLVLGATLKKSSSPTDTIAFRGGDNVTYFLTPDEMIALGLGVAARKSALYAKAWALKDAGPIPDYTSDSHWQ